MTSERERERKAKSFMEKVAAAEKAKPRTVGYRLFECAFGETFDFITPFNDGPWQINPFTFGSSFVKTSEDFGKYLEHLVMSGAEYGPKSYAEFFFCDKDGKWKFHEKEIQAANVDEFFKRVRKINDFVV